MTYVLNLLNKYQRSIMRYQRLLSRLLNTPLAISQSKLDIITSNVSIKLLAGEQIAPLPAEQVPTRRNLKDNKIAVIDVFDSLAAKNSAGMSGGTTYASITEDIQYYASQGYKKIYFYIDSPGGEVAGLFGLAAFISSLPTKYGIETVAVTDGMMTSAAYVLGAAAQKIYATESSIIGSIAVIMTLVNTMQADQQEGYEYTILRSKVDKALLNPHEKFPKKAVDEATSMLATLDTIMNKTVMQSRQGVSQELLDTLAGKTILAEEALSLGLIDEIVASIDEVISIQPSLTQIPLTSSIGNNMAMTLEDALVQLSAVQTELAALKASITLDVTKAKTEEQARILGILQASETFKIPTASAMKFIKTDTSVDVAVMSFEAIKEAIQSTESVDTSIGGLTATQMEEKKAESAKDFFLRTAAAAATNNDAIRGML